FRGAVGLGRFFGNGGRWLWRCCCCACLWRYFSCGLIQILLCVDASSERRESDDSSEIEKDRTTVLWHLIQPLGKPRPTRSDSVVPSAKLLFTINSTMQNPTVQASKVRGAYHKE